MAIFRIQWQTSTAGLVINDSKHEVYEVRLATWGDARVRARHDWHEDRASLRPGQSITFSQFQQRAGGLRIRFKYAHHPKAEWQQERLNLQPPSTPPSTLPEDPWSLGARRRAQLEYEARDQRDKTG